MSEAWVITDGGQIVGIHLDESDARADAADRVNAGDAPAGGALRVFSFPIGRSDLGRRTR